MPRELLTVQHRITLSRQLATTLYRKGDLRGQVAYVRTWPVCRDWEAHAQMHDDLNLAGAGRTALGVLPA